ncbi:unnamed protein product [Cyclocybe aegerita]|uniref:Fungal-type protein kinase domain-containing protein n=1 Tax=Cyclocybe aegerita TaxID=1973307 RepID=A0A8S0XH65_CYCAE|nr:unnamed protein product [Cyclocybe aegerita]
MTPSLSADLSGRAQNVDENYFNKVVKKRVHDSGFTNSSIVAFVERFGLYNRATERWSKFDAVSDVDLCVLLLQIFRNVIKSFGIKKRNVIKTHSTKLGDGDCSWRGSKGSSMKGKPLPGRLTDKVLRRLVLEAHGKPIWQLETPKQFLGLSRRGCCLFPGHRNLWDNGILHRDVSINNILIRDDNAEEGSRGTLIDLDLATCFGPDIRLPNPDSRTGTLEYQSIFIMMSEEEKEENPPAVLLPHDHLDDLESFFWVFCRVCTGYDQQGSKVKCPTIERWESEHLIVRLYRRTFLSMDAEWLQHNEVVHNFGAVLVAGLVPGDERTREGALCEILELLEKVLMNLAKEEGEEEKENVPPHTAASISTAPSHQPAPLSSHKSSHAAGVKRKCDQRDEHDPDATEEATDTVGNRQIGRE